MLPGLPLGRTIIVAWVVFSAKTRWFLPTTDYYIGLSMLTQNLSTGDGSSTDIVKLKRRPLRDAKQAAWLVFGWGHSDIHQSLLAVYRCLSGSALWKSCGQFASKRVVAQFPQSAMMHIGRHMHYQLNFRYLLILINIFGRFKRLLDLLTLLVYLAIAASYIKQDRYRYVYILKKPRTSTASQGLH